jgi:hypothetical protein
MDEKTLIELIHAYGQAKYDHGGSLHASASLETVLEYEAESRKLLVEIERRIQHAEYVVHADTGLSISELLDRKP